MFGSQDEIPPPPPPLPSSSQTPTQQTPHTVSTIKLPILKKGEYDIWAMKMEHYLAHTDYPIWEVIQNGNGPVSITIDTQGQIKVLPLRTAEEIVARERERKARTTLLMALPEDHLAKFHKMTDAKEMWDAIKSRFGGNDESKKMQKYILKQQFEGFSVSNSEGLHKGYDRFQSLLSQLEIHGAGVDSLSFDDLYNNLRVFENDVKGSTASSSSTQNVAFVSENTSSTNDVSTAYSVSNTSGQNSQYEQTSSYFLLANQSMAMISMRMKKFYKKTGKKLQFDAKEPVGFDKTKVECYNCHKTGHFARECRIKGNQDNRRRDAWNSGTKDGSRTGQKEDSKALVTIDGEGVDWTNHSEDEDYALMACNSSDSDTEAYSQGLKKVEAQLVAHQQGQLWYEQKIKFMKIDLDDKTDVLTYHKKLLAEAQKEKEDLKAKVEKWHNSSKNLSKLLNTQMSANDKFGLGYGDHRYDGILSYENEVLQSVFMNKESELEKQPLYDRFVTAGGMHAVPPPMTGNYMPSGPDIEVDYSQFTYGPKQTQPSESETQTSEFDTCESNISTEPSELVSEPVVNESNVECQPKVWSDAPIIEEYESDSEDEYVSIPTKEQETPSFANQQVKTPRETVKNQFTHSKNPKVDKKELGYGFTARACFVCGSLNHLIRDCDFHEKRMAKKAELNNGLNRNSTQREIRPIWNNVHRINKQNQFVPTAVLTRTGKIPVNTARASGTKNVSTARHNFNRQAVLTSTAKKVNTVKPIVNRVRPANVFHKTHSPSSRPFNKTTILRTNFSKQKVNTAKVNAVSAVGEKRETAVKPSAGCNWRPQRALKNKGIVDSGCSRHMTGNKAYLAEFQDFNGGPVAFGGSKGYITGKGKIKTGKLDFEDVCFVKELQHFNLFSVSQMCDKKNKVLFTDSECLVLSPEFKLPDENQVLLKIPRQNNMYSFNLENIVPSGGLACLIAKATIDESNKWHRRLGHVNFKNLNKLVKGNLVRGLPSKIFQNDHTCVACQKGKQHKASCKAKSVSSISHTLQLLHMDLFGPTSVRSLNHKIYCLVITDDFSRFSWVFFLRTKDETSGILKDFIRQIENQLNQKVKTIRCDNGIEFKNKDVIEFYGSKGIKREYSNARTPQQNGVAERKNMTLIEAARTMLADSFLPNTFWAEAVSTACYVLNRVLVTKPHNKTPYELITGKIPIISYIRPFGCHVTILNTIDHLGKFAGKSDEGFLVGYSLQSKAFRVYNLETKRVEENLHITFLENKPNVARKGLTWLFDLDYLTDSMNYQPVRSENQANKHAGPQEANHNAGTKDIIDAGDSDKEDESAQDCFVLPIWSSYSSTINPDLQTDEKLVDKEDQEFAQDTENLLIQARAAKASSTNIVNTVSTPAKASSTNIVNTISTPVSTASPHDGLSLSDPTNPEQDDSEIPPLEDIYQNPTDGIFTNSSYDDEGAVADFTNLETVVNVSPIPTLRINSFQGAVADFTNLETVVNVSPIPTSWINSFHPLALILGDPNSAVQTRSKVNKSSGAHAFVSYPYGKKAIGTKWVYQNKKDERGVVVKNKARLVAQGHRQEKGIDYDEVFAPMARIEAIRIFLAFASYMGFIVYQMDVKSAFLYGKIDEENGYRRGTIDKTLFLKKDKHDIVLVQVYVDDIIFGSTKKSWCDEFEALMKKILKKFDFVNVKTASTPIETQKPLVNGIHDWFLMYLTASRLDIMYLKGKPKLGLWYPRVSLFDLKAYSDSDYAGANLDRKSTTGEAEYVAAASCRGQNPIYHSKTKHIAIRHHFIRDAYEKKLIQVLKIHTDDNVADLLTKAFDVSRESLRRALDGTEALMLPTLFILWLATVSTDSFLNLNKPISIAATQLTYVESRHCSDTLSCFIHAKSPLFGHLSFRHSDSFEEEDVVAARKRVAQLMCEQISYVRGLRGVGKVTPLFASMLVQPTEDEGAPSKRPSEAQPTPSPPHSSEALVEPQTDPVNKARGAMIHWESIIEESTLKIWGLITLWGQLLASEPSNHVFSGRLMLPYTSALHRLEPGWAFLGEQLCGDIGEAYHGSLTRYGRTPLQPVAPLSPDFILGPGESYRIIPVPQDEDERRIPRRIGRSTRLMGSDASVGLLPPMDGEMIEMMMTADSSRDDAGMRMRVRRYEEGTRQEEEHLARLTLYVITVMSLFSHMREQSLLILHPSLTLLLGLDYCTTLDFHIFHQRPEGCETSDMTTPSPSPPISLSPPSAGERLARCMAPPAHSPPLSGCLTQTQTLRIASTQALIDAVTTALPPHSLPPLPPSLSIPSPVDRRDDILESEQPPRKRVDAEEEEQGIRRCWIRDLYALLEDAQDGRSRISQRVEMNSQRVDLLMGDRMTLQETVWMVEEEAYASREAWAHSIGLSQATHQELQTQSPPHDHGVTSSLSMQSKTELAALRETDRRRQDQMVETLRVIRDMRREMSDMQAELLALREQRRIARQSGPEARIPDHQEASGDADSHI
ncbi:putative ribonuclease H-like domain-containing protein [Tanacetum coccineum]|uniref:Ribonuclease H-like domain-containing protein n=1 Tax=Tanacetum coccineum TaxID=301880 RepID=A0ABQ5AR42_9ASTR